MRLHPLAGFSLVLLTFCFTGRDAHASASAAARAFDEGNQHYSVGNYRAAIGAYHLALDEGYASAALYYNLGSAHYRLDEIGQAIRFYERARLLAPDDPEIRHNLTLANERTEDRFSRLPVPVWERWWNALTRAVGSVGLFVIGSFFWFGAISILIFQQFHDERPDWMRRVFAVSTLVGIVALAAAFLASAEPSWNRTGVIVATEVPLRPEPSDTVDAELSIHEGLMVRILDTQPRWTRVRLPNGIEGWTEDGVVAEI